MFFKKWYVLKFFYSFENNVKYLFLLQQFKCEPKLEQKLLHQDSEHSCQELVTEEVQSATAAAGRTEGIAIFYTIIYFLQKQL